MANYNYVLDNTPMHQILEDTHNIIAMKMASLRKQQEALELETILREIKYTAFIMRSKKSELPVTANYFFEQYEDLINTAFNISNINRDSNKQLGKASALFRRSSDTSTVKGANNIFQEELASIFAAMDTLGGSNVAPIQEKFDIYLTGQKTSGTASMRISKQIQKQAMDMTAKAARRWSDKAVSTGLAENRSIKADVERVQTILSKDVSSKIQQLHRLTSGKSFSLKSYSSYRTTEAHTKDPSFSKISLGLGDTNLYKAITGSLSLTMRARGAERTYYRGMQILAGQTRPPDTDTLENVARHFSHLRFMYEFAGIGLLKEDGSMSMVDYFIYNDPDSENIAVRDTASIIFEEMNNSKRSNLFSGQVEIAASRIFANPLKNKY